ncbi:MAG TPA: pyridoxal phosphate-dependent aminotransferase [Syntrophales bacterium]|nr:pyridoxal phosphate-dependent aminotransferase [Syntrophales bacterium]HPX12609.1 pyridoxal phosphate-dependent aminotransferase [Syntrophales bacterium]HQN78040.1 pyridoxal phosphate-dependent aminotransferase [Syntrophales bacterium]HQQ26961.1 pyridoxal phosphate-dependent aminotransferase [Syntrophales bacterium]
MAISRKIEGFVSQSSLIRRMFEEGIERKKKYGAENVYDFSLGNPNLKPPAAFRHALIEAAKEEAAGLHGYMPNAGFPETRSAVAKALAKEHDPGLTADHVVMTCGAGGALNVVLKTLLDPGDEVLIPSPFFVEYRFYVDNHGGVTKTVETREDFSLDLDALERAVTERTKAVLINYPNNPTGKIYDGKSIAALGDLLRKKSREYGKIVYLLSDEPYREIVYDGVRVPSVFPAYENSIIATSYSKNLSIPGERIGFLAVHPGMTDFRKVMDALVLCNRILGYVNAPALMQRVIAKIHGVGVNVAEYRRKRDLLCDGLAAAGYRFEKPDGAFYLFPRTPIPDDREFVKILQKRNILAVPGSAFGRSGHIRIAYCTDDATIVRSLPGFAEALKEATGA